MGGGRQYVAGEAGGGGVSAAPSGLEEELASPAGCTTGPLHGIGALGQRIRSSKASVQQIDSAHPVNNYFVMTPDVWKWACPSG